jgi:hypothetical protein
MTWVMMTEIGCTTVAITSAIMNMTSTGNKSPIVFVLDTMHLITSMHFMVTGISMDRYGFKGHPLISGIAIDSSNGSHD